MTLVQTIESIQFSNGVVLQSKKRTRDLIQKKKMMLSLVSSEAWSGKKKEKKKERERCVMRRDE